MRAIAAQLLELGLKDRVGYQLVESLTTEVGARLAGSEAEARARVWAVDKFKQLGLSHIRVDDFEIPFWERGHAIAEVLAPYPQMLAVTALGGSISTGPDGATGEVVRFTSLADLQRQADNSQAGKIVFVDEMTRRTQDGSGYGYGSKKRRETAYEAKRLGASAALIRSVGTTSNRFPHTGQMHPVTAEEVPSVPTAALSGPDSDQLARMIGKGQTVSLYLKLENRFGTIAPSGNVIAEIPGREKPDEIVLIGAHLDSWDLGTGAVDDGAGVGIVMAAARLLLEHLPQAPRRTIRVVLFGAEEVGLVGAKDYAERHKNELARHVVATESDFGAGRVWRFDTGFGESRIALGAEFQSVLAPLGIIPGYNTARGGPDLSFIRAAGVPVVGLLQDGSDYFDLHHNANDTFDKIDPHALAQNVAAMAVFAYLAAEMEADFR